MEVVSLAGGEVEAYGVAECIYQGVNLGAQSASAEPDGFVVLGLFLRAPALC